MAQFKSMGAKTAGFLIAIIASSMSAGAQEEIDRLSRERFEQKPARQSAPVVTPAVPATPQAAPQAPAAAVPAQPAKPAAATAAKQPDIKPKGCVGFYEALCKESPECAWVSTGKNPDGTPAAASCQKKGKGAAAAGDCASLYEAACRESGGKCVWVADSKNKDGSSAQPHCKKKVTTAAKPKPKPAAPAPAAAAPPPQAPAPAAAVEAPAAPTAEAAAAPPPPAAAPPAKKAAAPEAPPVDLVDPATAPMTPQQME